MNRTKLLSGLRVLVVEDVFLVACDLADQLTAEGCEVVGPAPSVERALAEMEGIALDGALLDVNLRGELSFPIAEELAARSVPFVFLTGYDSSTIFPEAFQTITKLPKPVDYGTLVNEVARFRSGQSKVQG